MSPCRQVEISKEVGMILSRYPQQLINLKTLNHTNIDEFMEWAADDEVTRYMMWDSYSSKSKAEEFFETTVDKHPWFKGICLGERVIGSITLDKAKGVHSCKAELGYVVAKKYWGKGHATLAVQSAIQLGFQELEIERIEAFVDPDNIASQRVLEKNGFVREGLLKRCVVQKGIIKDRYVFAILK